MGEQTPREIKVNAYHIEVRHYPHSFIFLYNHKSFIGLIWVSPNDQIIECDYIKECTQVNCSCSVNLHIVESIFGVDDWH